MIEKRTLIVIKGAGDLASGIALRLHHCGFRLLLTELPTPLCIRRSVAFSSAVSQGCTTVEDVEACLIASIEQADDAWQLGKIPVLVDPDCTDALKLKPDVLIDARLMKSWRSDTHINDAPLVIGIGPGFCIGENADCIIETNRGHCLGRVIWAGEAEPNNGIPGEIHGESIKRVVRASESGVFCPCVKIGDQVKRGDLMAMIGSTPLYAPLDGIVRGVIVAGILVEKGLKIMDIDPRGTLSYCFTVSDKALAIGGGVLEAILARHASGSFQPQC